MLMNRVLPFAQLKSNSLISRSSYTMRRSNVLSRVYRRNKSDVMKIGRLNHVAIAVPDLEKATAFYRDVLGGVVTEPHALPDHGVTTVFVKLENSNVELLEPLGENSPIGKYIEKKPAGGMHHICLEVDDIHVALEQLKENNIKPIDPEPKIGAHGKLVVFIHPKFCNGVLVELEQK
eukprot:TRINITY_DN13152_c0_g1_i1.p1 TRINITY_DN13152_c0_g1~~TRINITY_DN13152_c0_g1_i1.p1  ORF type:complete len:184 (-),score=43.01 TRINITY_DN13152_c0_g1_i1:21-551(-)